jgi:mannose-6-phosphate isomerase-like protein (cupin superfamily)
MRVTDEACGGDPPCWAHLFEEEAGGADPDRAGAVDLAALARDAAGRGPAWTLRSEDLDVNLLVFGAGEGVAEHVNGEVDVLLVGVAGEGVVAVDGRPHPLGAGQAVLIPKGARRSIRAAGERFAYLTCHRRRQGLWPTGATR